MVERNLGWSCHPQTSDEKWIFELVFLEEMSLYKTDDKLHAKIQEPIPPQIMHSSLNSLYMEILNCFEFALLLECLLNPCISKKSQGNSFRTVLNINNSYIAFLHETAIWQFSAFVLFSFQIQTNHFDFLTYSHIGENTKHFQIKDIRIPRFQQYYSQTDSTGTKKKYPWILQLFSGR